MRTGAIFMFARDRFFCVVVSREVVVVVPCLVWSQGRFFMTRLVVRQVLPRPGYVRSEVCGQKMWSIRLRFRFDFLSAKKKIIAQEKTRQKKKENRRFLVISNFYFSFIWLNAYYDVEINNGFNIRKNRIEMKYI